MLLMKLQFEISQEEYEALKKLQGDDETLGGTVRRLLFGKNTYKAPTKPKTTTSTTDFTKIFGDDFDKIFGDLFGGKR